MSIIRFGAKAVFGPLFFALIIYLCNRWVAAEFGFCGPVP